jgi:hypothetical protein
MVHLLLVVQAQNIYQDLDISVSEKSLSELTNDRRQVSKSLLLVSAAGLQKKRILSGSKPNVVTNKKLESEGKQLLR